MHTALCSRMGSGCATSCAPKEEPTPHTSTANTQLSYIVGLATMTCGIKYTFIKCLMNLVDLGKKLIKQKQ